MSITEVGFHSLEGSDDAAAAAAAGLAPDLPTEIPGVGSLAFFKAEDAQYLAKILKEEDETELSMDEMKECKIMCLLLKIKNGTPPVRKTALRQITDKAREFGAGPLVDKILPLLMERTFEDQERHLLVKVIDRPLLIDEDYSKSAGLAYMISTMRLDIDHADEYVRNTTAGAFSMVASALGIPSLLPFLEAVCGSKKSWQARHTGIRIVQQIDGLQDEQQKVRTMTALALAALAEAAAPYGIESFDNLLKPLWVGIRLHRGKSLAAFLKAIGFILPLMDPEYVSYYIKEVTIILIREFQTSNEEMKKIVLKVVQQCAATEGVTPQNYRQVVETTVELAQKSVVAEIVGRIVNDLKDEAKPYRKMVMETITKVVASLGASDIDEGLEVRLVNGIIYSFQEQTTEDQVMLDGFGTVVNALGIRVKPYLTQIVSTILWRLNNKNAKVRQQAADLTTRLAVVIKQCGALSFVFEHTSVMTMLEDALTDCDLVHRRTASTIIKHLALGVAGLGCEDSMLHLMNLVWPNCFETSPHVIGAVMDAVEAMHVTLGPGVLLSYVLQGLFHPARKVLAQGVLCIDGRAPVTLVPGARNAYPLVA
ncbi:hypothetical protein CERSUDRAFT_93900 [Gelatoporia subvermispora B]|uniref:Splicing factor 3B subunit 1 domain-containing protein n=1 Tax=Ceriporiopsis subvermispora (strain B) TaxID=914234 RepID=M2RHU7_CERS8|nr:hypothetical protein CERSUDRAFT_93900 [Gelatoporia subvermispora B]